MARGKPGPEERMEALRVERETLGVERDAVERALRDATHLHPDRRDRRCSFQSGASYLRSHCFGTKWCVLRKWLPAAFIASRRPLPPVAMRG